LLLFFSRDAAPTEIYTLSLHDALPIWARSKIKQWFLKERREQALTEGKDQVFAALEREIPELDLHERSELLSEVAAELGYRDIEDRKSTRLNSSHVKISYAVFCLKKKT